MPVKCTKTWHLAYLRIMQSYTNNKKKLFKGFKKFGRKIVIGNKEWRWKIGTTGTTVIRSENGDKYIVDGGDLKGLESDTFFRGKYKRTTDGMITPKDIEQFILKQSDGLVV